MKITKTNSKKYFLKQIDQLPVKKIEKVTKD